MAQSNQVSGHSPSAAEAGLGAAEQERLAGRYAAALSLAQRAAADAEHAGEMLLQANAQLMISKIQDVQGDLSGALAAVRAAEALARRLNDAHLLCTALHMSVLVKSRLGMHEQSVAAIEEAIALAATLDDPALLFWCYNRAGCSEYDLGRHEIADQLMQRSLRFAENLGDEEKFCILNNLADNIAFWADRAANQEGAAPPQGALLRAAGYAERGLELARRSGNPYREALILTTQALVHALSGRLASAHAALDLADEIARKWAYRGLGLTSRHYRGKVLLAQGEPEQAITPLEAALELSVSLGEDLSSRDICKALALASEQSGRPGSSEYRREYERFDRKIASEIAALRSSATAGSVAGIPGHSVENGDGKRSA
jgi:tetratricopeptide (TPR) repeat protein